MEGRKALPAGWWFIMITLPQCICHALKIRIHQGFPGSASITFAAVAHEATSDIGGKLGTQATGAAFVQRILAT